MRNGNQGFTLLELLVVIAIGAAVGLAALSSTRHTLTAQARVTQMGELEDIRRSLRTVWDCKSTQKRLPSVCRPGTSVVLYDPNGKPVFQAQKNRWMTIGPYFLKATCSDRSGEFQVFWRSQGGPDTNGVHWKKLYSHSPPLNCAG